MRRFLSQLWADDRGAIIAVEWLFFATIVVIGIIVGLVAVRNAVVDELTTFANAVDNLGVCFSFAGLSNCESSVCGSEVNFVASKKGINTVKIPASNNTTIFQNPCAEAGHCNHCQ